MTQYDDTNRGQIWGNDKKEKDTQPDFKGSINIEGKEYWLSGWKRKPDAHPRAPALSLSVTAKEDAHQQGMAQTAQQTGIQQPAHQEHAAGSFDDDIPF